MFNEIHNTLQDASTITSIEATKESATDGVINFQIDTDDCVSPQLTYFQPETSTVVVKDGEIAQFDIQVGNWSPDNTDVEMNAIKDAASTAEQETYLHLSKIDTGDDGEFSPHLRSWEGPVKPNELTKFLDRFTTEATFRQSRSPSTPTATAP